MAATPIPLSTKDNAEGALLSTISPSDTSIPLEAGDGALFPQPYTGSCTSLGSSVTLNSTGVLAIIGAGSVGKLIWNATDGSVAVITAVATNAVTTTRLLGGSDNTWQNSDEWRIDAFVATFATLDAEGNIDDYEEALIKGRSTDTFTVAAGGRGYNSTTAQQFVAGAKVYLFVTSPIVERAKDIIATYGVQLDTNTTDIATRLASITAILNNSSFYAVATGSANAYAASYANVTGPIAAGMRFAFKANFSISGATTLTVTLGGSAQSATAIKKLDGATALVTGDIISGQIVVVEYDGTNFQMLTPVGTPAAIQNYVHTVFCSGANSTTLTNPTTATVFDTHQYNIPANFLTASTGLAFDITIDVTHGTAGDANLYLFLGSQLMASYSLTTPGTAAGRMTGMIHGTAAAGASVEVRSNCTNAQGTKTGTGYVAANLATNGTLLLSFKFAFGTSNAGNNVIARMSRIDSFSTTAF